jgi:hypothetical protein
MKDTKKTLLPLTALSVALSLGLTPYGRAQESGGTSSASPAKSQAQNQTQNQGKSQAQAGGDKQQQQAQQQAQAQIEKQRQEAQQQAEKSLDKDAMAAIDETKNALKAVSDNKTDEALAAIERAIGKINVVLARNPATALIPVAAEVEVIDAAPQDIKAIRAHAKAVERAVSTKDYPTARVLLYSLTSEIHVRTYNLPLATYPAALREAARLLDQNKPGEAKTVLQMALNTLVAVDRATPLPVVVAQTAIDEAQALRDQDKEKARQLLAAARHELERAKELGYTGDDPEYAALDKTIADLETQLRSRDSDTASTFSSLKERVASFFRRHSENARS